MPEPSDVQKVTISLDGRQVSAEKGAMIISAAEHAGTFIPRFCYHPRMEPVGNCRMCLVEVEGPRGSTLVPSCFVAVSDGMVVVTESEKVKKAQDGVLELLLTNHPLDCPVCDKGGECPLQDQTLTHGPGETRFVEEKRHFEKPIAISELVLLDRERCIQCSRCTRFADELAGEALIDFVGRGDRVEVATFPGEPFSSYFSGNTVQICPVGALTATPYRFAARPWDLEQVESTCTGCSVGCRVAVQSSAGRLTRLLGVDSDPVNHSWLCDKGRFSFEAVNGVDEGNEGLALSDVTRRLTEPMLRKGGELVSVSWGEALKATAEIIRTATEKAPDGFGAIGGAQLTNEGAFAWASLLKGVVGTDSVDAQLGDGLDAAHVLGLPRATIDEAASACTLVVLSGDLREEVPVLFLRLRAGAVAKRSSIIDLGPRSSSISPLAAVRLPARPGDATAIARALAGETAGLSAVTSHPEGRTFSDEDLAEARRLMGGDGEGVVIVLGRASLAEDSGFIEAAARTLHTAFPKASFLPVLRRANVNGALDMGLSPGLLPGRVALGDPATTKPSSWAVVPATEGRDTLSQLSALADGAQQALLVLGADPTTDVADAALVERAFAAGAPVVVVTGHGGPILAHAQVVLPAAVSHERGGTTTNLEGRVSRLGQKIMPPGLAWTDWMIAAELAAELGADLGISTSEEVTDQIARLAPSHAGVDRARLEQADAIDGILVPLSRTQSDATDRVVDPIAVPGLSGVLQVGLGAYAGVVRSEGPSSITASGSLISVAALAGAATPEAPAPDSYSLRLVTTRTLYDEGVFVGASSSLVPLRPASVVKANPYDLDRIGAADGSQVTLRSSRATVVAEVAADPGVLRGTLAIDAGLTSESEAGASLVATLLAAGELVMDVRMESL
jgi:NADH-quinone oxidoreductase subunit G